MLYTNIFWYISDKSSNKNTNICNTKTLYIEIQIHTFISIVSNRTTFTHFHLSHRSQPFFNWITCINGMVYLHLIRDFVHLDTQDINRCICVCVCLCSISSRRVHTYILFWRHIYKTLNGSGERLNAMSASFYSSLFFPSLQFFSSLSLFDTDFVWMKSKLYEIFSYVK